MRRIYVPFFALLISATSYSQSTRTTLVEEFTQASCGPCADQNPAFNAMLVNNESNVVSIKYQTSWPGTDPMNAHNPTEVATRVTYYGVDGVPTAFVDGDIVADDCGAYDGAPACLSQSELGSAAALSAPFSLNLSHSLSADFDSVYITANINCTQNVSGELVFHLVMVERTITFTTAPGSNGETEFYNVMKKMYPDANGTTIASSWVNGATQTLTFGVPVPSYMYNLAQMAFVGFIQDNNNRTVHQAGISLPVTMAASMGDISMSAISMITAVSCNDTIKPKITFKNAGTQALTSVTFEALLDGNLVASQNFSGNINAGSTGTFTMSGIYVGSGGHKLILNAIYPNGYNTDYSLVNNSLNTAFLNSTGIHFPYPYEQGFEGVFPDPNNYINNKNNDAYTWTQSNYGGFGTSNKCARLAFYVIPSGKVDELFVPAMDLSNAATAALSFDVAHRGYDNTTNDKLQVYVSTNCGTSWGTAVYSKTTNTGLETVATATENSFYPTSTEWRTENVDLTSYVGNDQVLIKFVGTSNYGNNLYLDNIDVSGAVGVKNVNSTNEFVVSPNPATNIVNLKFYSKLAQTNLVEIKNALGQSVYSYEFETIAGDNNLNIRTNDFNSGVYFVVLNNGTESNIKKLIINK